MSVNIRKVLISEKVDSACVKILENAGIKVDLKPGIPVDQLKNELKNYNALVVRSATKVTADVIAAGGNNLQVVGRAGTGVDNIDCDAATRNGVLVINAPGGNTMSAAELTCSMILSVARNIPQGCMSLKAGKWERNLFMGQEVQNKTLAIVGLGRIGREVAFRMQSFGMTTIGYDPFVTPEGSREFGVESYPLEDLWPKADFITIHTPLIPQTKNLLNDDTFKKCKKGVCIINCARGGIIDEDALLRALESGQVGGAGIDVFLTEPPQNTKLVQHPKVVGTPHLGASTKEAQIRVAEEIAEQFVALNNGKSVPGVVNAPTLQAVLSPENRPLIGLCENLAKVASAILNPQPLVKVQLVTKGNDMEKKGRFLTNAITVGLLRGQGQEANFVSAPALSKDAGIQVEHSHDTESKDTCCFGETITVSASSQGGKSISLQGAVQGKTPVLCSVNGASFTPPVAVVGDIVLCQFKSTKDSSVQLITNLSNQDLEVNSISWSGVVSGQQWCVVNLHVGTNPPTNIAENWAFVSL